MGRIFRNNLDFSRYLQNNRLQSCCVSSVAKSFTDNPIIISGLLVSLCGQIEYYNYIRGFETVQKFRLKKVMKIRFIGQC